MATERLNEDQDRQPQERECEVIPKVQSLIISCQCGVMLDMQALPWSFDKFFEMQTCNCPVCKHLLYDKN